MYFYYFTHSFQFNKSFIKGMNKGFQLFFLLFRQPFILFRRIMRLTSREAHARIEEGVKEIRRKVHELIKQRAEHAAGHLLYVQF